MTQTEQKAQLPEMFRPLLWGLKWDALDVRKDERTIILAAVMNGRLEHLRWIIDVYGKSEIGRVLSQCLVTEVHAGARNLARVLFGVTDFKHAR
jgi:hypothetical protein